MPKFMKMLNNISRSHAIYRHSRIVSEELMPSHISFVMAICRMDGCSQEELARELCLNKSTVARPIAYLEEKGYISRSVLPNDKRQFSVSPTEKMRKLLPEIKKASGEWMSLVTEGIPEEELLVFISVLERMHTRAREITERQEGDK